MSLLEDTLSQLGSKKRTFKRRLWNAVRTAYETNRETCFAAYSYNNSIEITKVSLESVSSTAPEGREYFEEGKGFHYDSVLDDKIMLVHVHPGCEDLARFPSPSDLYLVSYVPEIIAYFDGKSIHMVVVAKQAFLLSAEQEERLHFELQSELEQGMIEHYWNKLPKDSLESFIKELNKIKNPDGKQVFCAEYWIVSRKNNKTVYERIA
ncbi:hypothetical protein DRZ77_02320 [Candidatus Woesearchaeota archaeon]|mgnify:CR=1 FL=1|nr:hypothetical protein [Candidatus Woesearchaeota archaeon]RLE40430.1 MAG: hypothetical protein DRZ77_02320 [Candidatus Woesearchaeota archaeon]